MKNYHSISEIELINAKKRILNELEQIKHALEFNRIAEIDIKGMLWERYLKYKTLNLKIIIAKYLGGNSCDPKNYSFYIAKEITDPCYEREITKERLLWLNNNSHLLEESFDWILNTLDPSAQ